MATYYLAHRTYAYSATPTFGTAQDGDGTAYTAATVATVTIDMTSYTAAATDKFVIGSSNAASIALHRRAGFEHAGTVREAGFKFGRWLDLEFWQIRLAGPSSPIDG